MKIKHEGIHVRNNCNVRIPKMHWQMMDNGCPVDKYSVNGDNYLL